MGPEYLYGVHGLRLDLRNKSDSKTGAGSDANTVPEVDVEHGDGNKHGQCDQDHGEQKVLAEQRHGERRGRYDFDQEQEEDGEREQDGYAQGHLLTGLGW